MIEYTQLRALLDGWPKYPGCQRVRRALQVTSAFPGDFNLSSTEHHWVRELGGYLDWERDYVFTTIQSCVRLDVHEQRRRRSRPEVIVGTVAVELRPARPPAP